jgi:trimeric autotransporter adhesin
MPQNRVLSAAAITLAFFGILTNSIALAGVGAPMHKAISHPHAAPQGSTYVAAMVVDVGGAPVEGAVVVTSEGGRGVSDVDGAVVFTVDLQSSIADLHVTAVAVIDGANHTGTVEVDLARTAGEFRREIDAGVILLSSDGDCQPQWLPTFGGTAGVNDHIFAATVFDDGSGTGPALYISGQFSSVGGIAANRIARWDGTAWSSLADGPVDGAVHALAVFDDGTGAPPSLYVGGSFTTIHGVSANNIAKWDGTNWSALGSGTNGPVYSLTVFDDGSGDGPALYVGGWFTSAGGIAANRIARWRSVLHLADSGWSPVGAGTNGIMYAMTVFDDGSGDGPALYVGGSFDIAGGQPANRIARWDGNQWSPLGSAMNGSVRALTVFDDGLGDGPALYAGGTFTIAGGVAANCIARWDGTAWSTLNGGMEGGAFLRVNDLRVHDDGTGPMLFAGGNFTSAGGVSANHLAKWDGTSWSALGDGMDNEVRALVEFANGNGNGPALYSGGDFIVAGEIQVNRIAKWNGVAWSAISDNGISRYVHALTVFDDGAGDGPALFVAGSFQFIDVLEANGIARWDGTSWTALDSGVHDGSIFDLAIFDDGSGPALFAGGGFTSAGDTSANRIAKWDGTSWSALGDGVNGHVFSMTAFDDGLGEGPALYVGGAFTTADGLQANRIARWDGTKWSPLGTGMNQAVRTLAVFDDGSGSGPALYAGGEFITAGSVSANRIARWNGTLWSPLGGGLNSVVRAMIAFDDGSGDGPALYVGGSFLSAGGTWVSRIARWNGVAWSALTDGMTGISGVNNSVYSLTVFDDGTGNGPALYAGGFSLPQEARKPTESLAGWHLMVTARRGYE